ncbi:MAG: shikimate kinase [Rhodocyclaceae bacterium]|nr:shikimate kinase [Rhodocyclaceae bacterium]
MKSCDNIFLVGMMGAGKTTVGRQLARRLRLRFVDSDHEIEARCGVKIPVIFEIEGEDGFRRRESQVLGELAEEPGLVIATGGGAVLRAENRACLATHGTVIYLAVPPQYLWERTRHDVNRPLLQVENPRKRIEELHAARDPLYREVADIVISGGRVSQGTVLKLIEKELKERCQAFAAST